MMRCGPLSFRWSISNFEDPLRDECSFFRSQYISFKDWAHFASNDCHDVLPTLDSEEKELPNGLDLSAAEVHMKFTNGIDRSSVFRLAISVTSHMLCPKRVSRFTITLFPSGYSTHLPSGDSFLTLLCFQRSQ